MLRGYRAAQAWIIPWPAPVILPACLSASVVCVTQLT
jgi:hypothetical protein